MYSPAPVCGPRYGVDLLCDVCYNTPMKSAAEKTTLPRWTEGLSIPDKSERIRATVALFLGTCRNQNAPAHLDYAEVREWALSHENLPVLKAQQALRNVLEHPDRRYVFNPEKARRLCGISTPGASQDHDPTAYLKMRSSKEASPSRHRRTERRIMERFHAEQSAK